MHEFMLTVSYHCVLVYMRVCDPPIVAHLNQLLSRLRYLQYPTDSEL